MSLIAEYGQILLILVCVFGFFMAWGVEANDVVNAMGTSIGRATCLNCQTGYINRHDI